MQKAKERRMVVLVVVGASQVSREPATIVGRSDTRLLTPGLNKGCELKLLEIISTMSECTIESCCLNDNLTVDMIEISKHGVKILRIEYHTFVRVHSKRNVCSGKCIWRFQNSESWT